MICVNESMDKDDLIKEVERIFYQHLPNGYLLVRKLIYGFDVQPLIDSHDGDSADIDTLFISVDFRYDYNSGDWIVKDNPYNCIELKRVPSENALYYEDLIDVAGTPEEVLDAWDKYCFHLYKTLIKLRRKGLIIDRSVDSVKDL